MKKIKNVLQIGLRLEAELRDKVQAEAEVEGRSLNSMLVQLVKRGLNK